MPDGFDSDHLPYYELDLPDPDQDDARYPSGEATLRGFHQEFYAGHYAEVANRYTSLPKNGDTAALTPQQQGRLLYLVAHAQARLGRWRETFRTLEICSTQFAIILIDPIARLHIYLLYAIAADSIRHYHRSSMCYDIVLASIDTLQQQGRIPPLQHGTLTQLRCRALIGRARANAPIDPAHRIAHARQDMLAASTILTPWLEQRFQWQIAEPAHVLPRQLPPNLLPFAAGADELNGRLFLSLHAANLFIELWLLRNVGHEDPSTLNWIYANGREMVKNLTQLPGMAERTCETFIMLAEYTLELAQRHYTEEHYYWPSEARYLIDHAQQYRHQLEAGQHLTYVIGEVTDLLEYEYQFLQKRNGPRDAALAQIQRELERFCVTHRDNRQPDIYLRGRGHALLSRFYHLYGNLPAVDKQLALARQAFDHEDGGDEMWAWYIRRHPWLHA